jgi:hypothetical protein
MRETGGLFQKKLPLERSVTEDKAISNVMNDITQVSETENVRRETKFSLGKAINLTTSNI